MTWSVCAHDPATGAFAVAVATRAFAVGASCPFLRRGAGALSTQSFTNRYLGPAALDAMARGIAPGDAIRGALCGDAGEAIRQVHAVDARGRAGAHTGARCVPWAGHLARPGASFAGNMLAGPEVLEATARAWDAGAALPLPERLMAAMEAGEAAGGDRRGRQSAAMALVTTEDFRDLDLRVDDHPEPLAELRRLLDIWRRERAPYLDRAPSRADPSGETDLDAIEGRWRAAGLDLRFGGGPPRP